MKKLLALLVAAFEAFAVALVSYAVVAVPALILWMATFDMSAPLAQLLAVASGVWLLGHALPLSFDITAAQAYDLGASATAVAMPLSLPLLGILAITILGGVRAGARSARGADSVISVQLMSVLGAALGFGVVAMALAGLGQSIAAVSLLWLVFKPVFFYMFSFLSGVLYTERVNIQALWRRLAVKNQKYAKYFYALSYVPRMVTGTLLMLLLFAGIAFAVCAGLQFTEYVRLSQSMQFDVFGVVTIFILQFLLLPVALIWIIAWFTGVGFSVGANTLISPFEMLPGPIPGLPIFGLLPQTWGDFGLFGPALLCLCIVIVGLKAAKILTALEHVARLITVAVSSLAVGVIAVLMFALARGAIGPGGLQVTGTNPMAAGAVLALITFIGLACGIWLKAVPQLAVESARTIKQSKLLTRSAKTTQAVGPVSTGADESLASSADETFIPEMSDYEPLLLKNISAQKGNNDSLPEQEKQKLDSQTIAAKRDRTAEEAEETELSQLPPYDADAEGGIYETGELLKGFEWQNSSDGKSN